MHTFPQVIDSSGGVSVLGRGCDRDDADSLFEHHREFNGLDVMGNLHAPKASGDFDHGPGKHSVHAMHHRQLPACRVSPRVGIMTACSTRTIQSCITGVESTQ